MTFFEFVPLEEEGCHHRCSPCVPPRVVLLRHSTTPPSSPLTSTGSHRQHAAELKRQELLNRRRERMAARVQHAKLVAEKHRHQGKNTSQERFGRLELQLKAAESNRTMLLQRAKEQCAAVVTHAKLVCQRHRSLREEAISTRAATCLQRWWRHHKFLSPALAHVAALSLSVSHLEGLGFEVASELIQSDAVTVPLAHLFATFRRISAVSSTCIRGKRPERSFLAGHLMVAYPDITASPDGSSPSDVTLGNTAASMIEGFWAWASHPTGRKGSELLEKFIALFYLFCDRFEEWRTPDSKKLLARLVLHFEDLEAFREQIRGNTREWDLYVPQIVGEKQRLIKQMRKLGAEKLARKWEARANKDDNINVNINNNSSSSSSPSSSSTSSPPISTAAAPLFDENQRLMHQLATNPDFEFKVAAQAAGEEGDATEAIWDHVELEIQAREFSLVRVYFFKIREALSLMVPESKAFHVTVDETLTPDHLHSGNIAPELLMPVVLEMMGRICAPARDESIRSLKRKCHQARTDAKTLTLLMRESLSCLEQMHIDLANYHLKAIKPALKGMAVEYERDKFKARLASGEIQLEKTKAWLNTVRRVQSGEGLSPNDPEGLYFRGVCHLVLSPQPLTPADLPEVLLLDEDILFSSRRDFRRMILVATFMTLSRNVVADLRDPAFGAAQIQQRLDLLLQDQDTKADNVCVFLLSEFSKRLAALGKPQIPSQHAVLLKGLLEHAFEGQDTVFKLLTRRVREYLEAHHFRGKKVSDDFFRKAGLEAVKEELILVADKLARMVSHSYGAFGSFCDLNVSV